MTLLELLNQAGTHAEKYPTLCVQWLGHSMRPLSELPLAMVAGELRGRTYFINYRESLNMTNENSKALAIQAEAVALFRSLASRHGRAM